MKDEITMESMMRRVEAEGQIRWSNKADLSSTETGIGQGLGDAGNVTVNDQKGRRWQTAQRTH